MSKYPPFVSAAQIVSARTAEARALLYEAALRELEEHRDDLIAACATLRRLMETEQRIAARERGEPVAGTKEGP